MRLALLYPPPWKIPDPEKPPDPAGDGPPRGFRGFTDADFFQVPYGLLSLAAQALRAGHDVKVLNLSAFAWSRVVELLSRLEADVYGLSCFTANRRGVALTAREIRRHHPRAHIVAGGPHVTVLAAECLARWPEVDTVVRGEGEATLAELLTRLQAGQPVGGLKGTAYRDAGGGVQLAPARAPLGDLDDLVPPQRIFDTHILLTSRGCPGHCSFCASKVVWGKAYRSHSVSYVLDAIERVLARLPLRMLMIKDDTFAANRRRALGICRGIVDRKLSFVWSCDTRADALSDELLRAMRLAGCQRLSLGVESGSAEILRNIDKNVTPERILEATELAKRYGFEVRYYMMLGNRGETAATFRESLRFLARAKPHQAYFTYLSLYPGTRDYDAQVARGTCSPESFFTADFKELKLPLRMPKAEQRQLLQWFEGHKGGRSYHEDSVAECQAVLQRLGDFHGAHLDLAGAHYRASELSAAAEHARRALQLGTPTPGLAHNYLACIAARRGDYDRMQAHLTDALGDLQHQQLVDNLRLVDDWVRSDGQARGLPLELQSGHDFHILERSAQPMLPGPLPADIYDWP